MTDDLQPTRSIAETARACGVSEATVRRLEHIFRARLAVAILTDPASPPILVRAARRTARTLHLTTPPADDL